MRSGHLPEEGKAMPQGQSRLSWRRIALAAAVSALACQAAYAKDSTASVKDAEQYVAKGNLKAAEIELRNAIRESPQDPVLHARLADIYLQLGEIALAEREARAARERNGNEADYLPVLTDALLRQNKFADLARSGRAGRPQSCPRKQGQDGSGHRRRRHARSGQVGDAAARGHQARSRAPSRPKSSSRGC